MDTGGQIMKFRIGKFHFNFSFWISKDEVQGKKGGRPRIVIDTKEVIRLHDAGKSVREIASIMHVSKSTVSNVLRNPEKYNNRRKK